MLDPQRAPFLTLPYEIRSQIYKYFVEEHITLKWIERYDPVKDDRPSEKNALDDGSSSEQLPSSWICCSHWTVEIDPSASPKPSYSWMFICRAIYHEVAPRYYNTIQLDFQSGKPVPIGFAISLLSHQYRSLISRTRIGKLWLSEPWEWETSHFKCEHSVQPGRLFQHFSADPVRCPCEWGKGDHAFLQAIALLLEILPGLRKIEVGVTISTFWGGRSNMKHTITRAVIVLALLIDRSVTRGRLGRASDDFWAQKPRRGHPDRREIMAKDSTLFDFAQQSLPERLSGGKKSLNVRLQRISGHFEEDPTGCRLWEKILQKLEAYQQELALEQDLAEDDEGAECIVVSSAVFFPA